MNKLMIILLGAMLGVVANAQNAPTKVTANGYISGDSYVYLLGTTSDTLTNADTTTYVLRVKGTQLGDYNFKAGYDHVSGTAGGTLIMSQSIDGVNYFSESGDTITLSGITADGVDTEVINKVKFLYPYAKFTWTQSGTAVIVPKIYVYTKQY